MKVYFINKTSLSFKDFKESISKSGIKPEIDEKTSSMPSVIGNAELQQIYILKEVLNTFYVNLGWLKTNKKTYPAIIIADMKKDKK